MILLVVALSVFVLGTQDADAQFGGGPDPKDFPAQEGCTNEPNAPKNGHIYCGKGHYEKICWMTCNDGYLYAAGGSSLTLKCAWGSGIWATAIVVPDCLPQFYVGK
ncbi:uncharacterized protein [Littorina saxatilis]|uniref:uncharacterized protein isoform X1 n=1 Tax=Littorina saxatilis TaxID=31220 RepID=UPI0038B52DE9